MMAMAIGQLFLIIARQMVGSYAGASDVTRRAWRAMTAV